MTSTDNADAKVFKLFPSDITILPVAVRNMELESLTDSLNDKDRSLFIEFLKSKAKELNTGYYTRDAIDKMKKTKKKYRTLIKIFYDNLEKDAGKRVREEKEELMRAEARARKFVEEELKKKESEEEIKKKKEEEDFIKKLEQDKKKKDDEEEKRKKKEEEEKKKEEEKKNNEGDKGRKISFDVTSDSDMSSDSDGSQSGEDTGYDSEKDKKEKKDKNKKDKEEKSSKSKGESKKVSIGNEKSKKSMPAMLLTTKGRQVGKKSAEDYITPEIKKAYLALSNVERSAFFHSYKVIDLQNPSKSRKVFEMSAKLYSKKSNNVKKENIEPYKNNIENLNIIEGALEKLKKVNGFKDFNYGSIAILEKNDWAKAFHINNKLLPPHQDFLYSRAYYTSATFDECTIHMGLRLAMLSQFLRGIDCDISGEKLFINGIRFEDSDIQASVDMSEKDLDVLRSVELTVGHVAKLLKKGDAQLMRAVTFVNPYNLINNSEYKKDRNAQRDREIKIKALMLKLINIAMDNGLIQNDSVMMSSFDKDSDEMILYWSCCKAIKDVIRLFKNHYYGNNRSKLFEHFDDIVTDEADDFEGIEIREYKPKPLTYEIKKKERVNRKSDTLRKLQKELEDYEGSESESSDGEEDEVKDKKEKSRPRRRVKSKSDVSDEFIKSLDKKSKGSDSENTDYNSEDPSKDSGRGSTSGEDTSYDSEKDSKKDVGYDDEDPNHPKEVDLRSVPKRIEVEEESKKKSDVEKEVNELINNMV